MSTNRLKNQFVWEEEIPQSGQKEDLFRDRIFVVSDKRGKIIKFSASFSYDLPEIRFEMKIVEGRKILGEQPLEVGKIHIDNLKFEIVNLN